MVRIYQWRITCPPHKIECTVWQLLFRALVHICPLCVPNPSRVLFVHIYMCPYDGQGQNLTHHSCQGIAKLIEETRSCNSAQPNTATVGTFSCRPNPILHSIHWRIHAYHTHGHTPNYYNLVTIDSQTAELKIALIQKASISTLATLINADVPRKKSCKCIRT